ncbi:carbamoyltransferase HypF [Nodosilinea sp. LEGE 07088]|uniref:carbamoyltransferase HypF n=1 Tax=Nodosilinea sp. LEGE 07088 TaxID=2777968 RepID=UPI00187E521F|nr:carbamoyltransferase HypF [Nodosilinea sp. LEGE 07088]MBE9137083.1 carbamoyltransferase HypF [Nodosilinea sp. LEGE 07088]
MTTTSLIQRRICLTLRGRVQGVGFRPFVYQLATALGLRGGVTNTPQGVVIDIEGPESALEQFVGRLQRELPPHATIQSLTQQSLPVQGANRFQIWPSEAAGDAATAQILPDLATCPACLADIFDPHNRRYRYPFTNCTHCGPRFSILTALPYDRRHTTMTGFTMCPACEAEYTNPSDRRFHAQPNACPDCGPQLEFWVAGKPQVGEPLQAAIAALRRGEILALKGLGGFQLLVDAQNPAAVERLRQRKQRPDKPLALMYATLEQIRRDCEVSEAAAALLTAAQAPIVLLPKRLSGAELAEAVAPDNLYLGVMLPTTPLHHLLLQQYGSPLVATSGNRSGEPICADEQLAHHQLGAIADGFLIHDRPIRHPVDDSVVQIVQERPQILRHARGYAPQVVQLADSVDSDTRILAVGAHLKNAIALSLGSQVMLSQYIGDLETPQAMARSRQTVADFLGLYRCQPTAIACDLHPDYGSTRLAQTLAQQWQVPLIPVQHHYAHGLSAMAEHQLQAPVLGVAWDGTGYGPDQTIWGGEFLQITDCGFERVAYLLPFPLPGGNLCSREPRRSALGLLYGCYGEAAFELTDLAPVQAFAASERNILRQMLAGSINAPMTSSMGRLFDGMAALLDLHQTVSFEGQAAMALEFAANHTLEVEAYPFTVSTTLPGVIDWRPLVRAVIRDQLRGVPAAVISTKFHQALVEMIGAIAQRVGLAQVVLTGGCFQNRLLSQQAIRRLCHDGFTPYWHQRVPPNDGGIALGQMVAALRHLSCIARAKQIRTPASSPDALAIRHGATPVATCDHNSCSKRCGHRYT